jgi:hypothetical protein
MRLGYAFLANSAKVAPDGRFHVLGGGIDGFKLPFIPTMLPTLAVVAAVHVPPEECGPSYQLRMKLTSPDGTEFGFEPFREFYT